MKTILAAVSALSLGVGAAYAAGAPVGSFNGHIYDRGIASNSHSAGAASSSTKGG